MMKEVAGIPDWEYVEPFFERDGTLRELYVGNTVSVDWASFLQLVSTKYKYRLTRFGSIAEFPRDVMALFVQIDPYCLQVPIAKTNMVCNFYSIDQLELLFEPEEVDQCTFQEILRFMIAIGNLLHKPVAMTAENVHQRPFLSYNATVNSFALDNVTPSGL